MPNYHTPIIIDRAPVYRALLLECERRRQQLGWAMWQVDEASGVQECWKGKSVRMGALRLSRWQCAAGWPYLRSHFAE